jgi:hypothetical protein
MGNITSRSTGPVRSSRLRTALVVVSNSDRLSCESSLNSDEPLQLDYVFASAKPFIQAFGTLETLN